jgi:4-hydroxy-tetrahydrodipicolinate synthase
MIPRWARLVRRTRLGIVAALISAIVTGISFAALAQLAHYPLFYGLSARYVVASLGLLCFLKRRTVPSRHDLVLLGLVAAIGMVGFNAAFIAATRSMDSGTVGAVVGSFPVAMALTGALLNRRRPPPSVIACAVAASLGSAMVEVGSGSASALGFSLALVALAFEVVFTLLLAELSAHMSALDVAFWSCCIAAPMAFVVGALEREPLFPSPATGQLLALAYLAVVVSTAGLTLWTLGVEYLGPERFATLTSVAPVVGLGASALFGTAVLTPLSGAGCLLVAAAVVVSARPPSVLPCTVSLKFRFRNAKIPAIVRRPLGGRVMGPIVGVMPPCITFFDSSGEIDFERTRRHVDWLVDAGVDALLGIGTCGEFFSLDLSEREALTEALVEWVDSRVPLYVGVMHTSTRTAIQLARSAQKAGATGILSVSPYYSSPPEREVLQYFRDLASSVDLPLIVYNNPSASGVALSVSALATLANEGTAAIIKESHGDPTRIHDLKLAVSPDTSVIYGEDYGSFEAIMGGADGWVAGVGNFMPRHCVELWRSATQDDVATARRYWYELLPLVNMTSNKPLFGRLDERPDFIQIYKAALDWLGLEGGPCRRPLLPLPNDDLTYLGKLMTMLQLTPDKA